MSNLIHNLKKLAEHVAAEKKLHLMALVHPSNAPWDRWDLLVSADQLQPRSLDAMVYIDALLKKYMTQEERLKIATIVPLPKNNKIVEWVLENGEKPPGDLKGVHPQDHFDKFEIIWRKTRKPQAA